MLATVITAAGPPTTAVWVSAVASSVAALIALFGPAIRGWWARPRIELGIRLDTLTPNDELIVSKSDFGWGRKRHYVTLEVTNVGRTQLDDLEAVVTAWKRIGPIDAAEGTESDFWVPVVSNGMLQFEIASPDHQRVVVPPQSKRVLRLAYLGFKAELLTELEARGEELPTGDTDICAGLSVWPLEGSDRVAWFNDDDEVTLEISLAARNARSRSWTCVVKFFAWDMEDDEAALAGVSTTWVRDLSSGRFRDV